MKGFQLIKNGKPVTMKEADESAALFWNKEVDSKQYCNPYHKKQAPDNLSEQEKHRFDITEMQNEAMSLSWFTLIGMAIAEQDEYAKLNSWENVIHTMCCKTMGESVMTNDIKLPNIKIVDDKVEYDDILIIRIVAVVDFFRPYVNLIEYWKRLGWEPKMMDE